MECEKSGFHVSIRNYFLLVENQFFQARAKTDFALGFEKFSRKTKSAVILDCKKLFVGLEEFLFKVTLGNRPNHASF